VSTIPDSNIVSSWTTLFTLARTGVVVAASMSAPSPRRPSAPWPAENTPPWSVSTARASARPETAAAATKVVGDGVGSAVGADEVGTLVGKCEMVGAGEDGVGFNEIVGKSVGRAVGAGVVGTFVGWNEIDGAEVGVVVGWLVPNPNPAASPTTAGAPGPSSAEHSVLSVLLLPNCPESPFPHARMLPSAVRT